MPALPAPPAGFGWPPAAFPPVLPPRPLALPALPPAAVELPRPAFVEPAAPSTTGAKKSLSSPPQLQASAQVAKGNHVTLRDWLTKARSA
jgi:hypothetical protein